MGKATYRGTVLSGRDNFDTWKKDLMNFLRAEDLVDFIDGSAEDPSNDEKEKTAAGSTQVEAVTKEKKAEIKEYRKKESTCNVAVLNSLDEYHKKSVQSLNSPKEVFDFAIKKYAAPNAARRAQLLNSIYAVSTQKNKTVQEKVDSLRNLKAELDGHKDRTQFPEEILTQFLKTSMDEEYETTIEIINNERGDISFDEVANRLENKETELKGKAIADEVVNFAGRGRNGHRGRESRGGFRGSRGPEGGCYTCGGPHWKKQCVVWHKTGEGRKWLLSDEGKYYLMGQKLKEQKNSKKSNTREEDANMARFQELSDSESEFASAYSKFPEAAMMSKIAMPQWYLDTCASTHISNRKDQFIGELKSSNVKISVAKTNASVTAKGIGDVRICWLGTDHVVNSTIVRDVLYVPEASDCLLSVGKLEDRGSELEIKSAKRSILLRRNGNIVIRGYRKNRMWLVAHPADNKAYKSSEISTRKPEKRSAEINLLHARLGHPGKHMDLLKVMDGLEGNVFCPPFCESCTLGKMTRNPSREPMSPVTEKLERVHMDLYGPVPVPSLQGKRYMLTITDQKTGRIWVYFRANKMHIVQKIKDWVIEVENECRIFSKGEKCQRLRFDRGREFLNRAMQAFCKGRGTQLEPTVGYFPEGDGVSERSMRTISERGRTMRLAAGLPEEYWEFSYQVAAWYRNRQQVKKMDKSPWEQWRKTRCHVDHLRTFGCPAYVFIPKKKRSKLAARAWKGVFVGYTEESEKLYLVWHPEEKKVFRVRFVRFDESRSGINDEDFQVMDDEYRGEQMQEKTATKGQGDQTAVEENDDDEDDDVSPNTLEESGGDDRIEGTREIIDEENANNQGQGSSYDSDASDTIVVNTGGLDDKAPRPVPRTKAQERKEKAAEKKEKEEIRRQEIRAESQAQRQRSRGDGRSRKTTEQTMMMGRHFDTNVKKLTYNQLAKSPDFEHWKEAIQVEAEGLKKQRTFSEELVPPPGAEIVSSKLVFDRKKDRDGNIDRYKARLVARGFTQEYGISYRETFAPTIRLSALKTIIALAAKHGWKLHNMDVVAAFLAESLPENEVVYIQFPPELRSQFGEYRKILKSLYGLKQAARLWYLLLTRFLESIGFKAIPWDDTIFVNEKTGVIIGVHVDDMLLTGADEAEISKVKKLLKGRFDMKDLGEADYLLGIRIQRYEDGAISIDQSVYAKDVVDEYLDYNASKSATPMEPDAVTNLSKGTAEELTSQQHRRFQELLGKLIWLCVTRSDIAMAVNKIASFTACAKWDHWMALQRVLGYISRTLTFGIWFGGKNHKAEGVIPINYYDVDHGIEAHVGAAGPLDTMAFSDSDYAADPRDRKSLLGFVLMVHGGVVLHYSKKMNSVARSTTEAETVGMSEALKQVIWLRRLIAILEGHKDDLATVPMLYGDNKGAVQGTRGTSNTSKIKHIDIAHHHIVDEVKKGTIKTYWVPGENMLADGMTKPLPRDKFERNRAAIGIRKVV
jgi:hypothetical protein